jgi:hypothetical protein
VKHEELQAEKLSLFNNAFDKLYPAIRFTYEKIMGNSWFSQITPQLWLGGAPTYQRDYDYILQQNITAVLNVRAEREDDKWFFDRHGISHVQYPVPEVTMPVDRIITEAVAWIKDQVDDGRIVLVHCAKGRCRSAMILAGYMLREKGMSFDEANTLLKSKRSLAKLHSKHCRVLETWLAVQS